MRFRLLVCVAVLVAGCSGDTSGGQADGPLTGALPGEIGIPVEVGQVVTVGYTSLFNPGDAPARVEGVRLLPPDQLELVEVRTMLLPRDGGGIIGLPEFPPKDYPSRTLAEQNVVAAAAPRAPGEPEPNLQVLVGVRTSRPGVFRTEDVEVTYSVGSRRFVETFPVKIILCAPTAPYFGGCDQFTQPKPA